MDFVLVHGTAQSPQGWRRLSDELQRRGHRAELIDLAAGPPAPPAAAGAPGPDAAGYAARAAAQAGRGLRNPVLVAHSGAGVLMPALAAALAPSHLVWLAAYVPAPGQRSYHDEVQQAAAQMFGAEWRSAAASVLADPVVAAYFLFHDCDLPSLRWGLSTLRLFSPAEVYREVPAPRPSGVPSTFVLPRGDRTLRPDWMRAAARERLGVEPVEIDSGHCPHVSQPEVLAATLEQLDRPRIRPRIPAQRAAS